MLVDLVGWASTLILIATISRQVYTQWRTRSIAGVSKWLFIGQISASIGFTIYSYLVGNTVFVLTNAFLLVTAIVGECIYLRNKRMAERGKAAER